MADVNQRIPRIPTLVIDITARTGQNFNVSARNGKPITRRRYNYLFERLGRYLPWVITHGISIHWLRHTTTTWVERRYGGATAREFARHALGSAGPTGVYTTATINEVASALAHLTGEPHPLATTVTLAQKNHMTT
ncbi:hypothetical protein [Nocardia nepalensis]|uniref:hypothetical protein n=1 Tax=Nocardia nepalensis TaxID=3375448 RepID=UPI003B6806C0